jgi:adiponectin receptor
MPHRTHRGALPRLLSYESLKKDSEWSFLADSEFIKSGYRHRLTCFEALRSLFSLHNETVNVWTHLAGAILFLVLLGNVGLLSQKLSAVGVKHGKLLVDGMHTPLLVERFLVAPHTCSPSWSATYSHELSPRFAALHAALDTVRSAQLQLHETAANSLDLLHQRSLIALSHAQIAFDDALRSAETLAAVMQAGGAERAQNALRTLGRTRDSIAAGISNLQQHASMAVAAELDSAENSMKDLAVTAQTLVGSIRLQLEDAVRSIATITRYFEGQRHWHWRGSSALKTEQQFMPAEHSVIASVRASGSGFVPATSESLAMWPLAVFIFSAFICLSLSTAFHLLHPVSAWWFQKLAALDYTGIAVLTAGSSYPLVYLGFYCMPYWSHFHMTAITAVCSCCVYLSLSDRFSSSAYRLVRMTAFIITGCYGILPIVHLIMTGVERYHGGLYGIAAMGALYIGGALLYGFRVPERFFRPGTFDLVLASHQIFHVCVVAAAFVHYVTVRQHYEWRAGHSSCDVRID